MSINTPPRFRGRTRERERLDGLLEQVRRGRSGVLVIRAEAGAGKTALLRYAGGQAAGFRVGEIAGVESEMELPFAGLHQLCAPMFAHLDALPDPQQGALRTAFGLSSDDPPDRFLVALAALSLLAEVAEEQPLLCLVDDAQWLDTASRQVFAIVTRRLLAEPVALVLAVREPADERELVGLPEMSLAGLADDDARAFVEAAESRAGSISECGTGSWLKLAGTRLHCWSCRGALRRRSSREDLPSPTPEMSWIGSRTNTGGASLRCPTRPDD